MTAPEPEFLTAAEVAAKWHVKKQTVHQWIARGAYPGAFKTPGGEWRIPSAEVEAGLRPQAAGR